MSPIHSNPPYQQAIPSPAIQRIPLTETLKPVQDAAKDTKPDSLEILTTAISDFLTPTVTATNDKRKHRLDRPYVESLTTVEALHKIQEKENQAQKRKKRTTARETIQTKKAPAKR